MKNMAKLMIAVAVPALIMAAGYADAKKKDKMLDRLVKIGALKQDDLKGLMDAKAKVQECRAAVKKGEKKKGECLTLKIESRKAKIAVLEQASKFDKLPPKVGKKIAKSIKKLNKKIGKLERKIKKLEGKAKAAPPAETK
jgi:outer membrane murein-binding lipoprotein Lpp